MVEHASALNIGLALAWRSGDGERFWMRGRGRGMACKSVKKKRMAFVKSYFADGSDR